MMRRTMTWVVSGALLLAAGVAHAGTVTIVKDAGATNTTTALTSSATSGDEMDGMSVTAYFANGTTEARSWVDYGVNQGEVVGTDGAWGLWERGDTFNGEWTLWYNAMHLSSGISSVVIDAGVGNTVFDTTFGGVDGTTDSAAGKDFTLKFGNALGSSQNITATYSGEVAISGNAAVGDLFRFLEIRFDGWTFGPSGGPTSFVFYQDTDNIKFAGDIQSVPLPSAVWSGLALLGGLRVVSRLRRRKPTIV